jgi:transketolase
MTAASTRRDLANAVRALAMDAVQAANSGHPGMPMGMADIAEVLWNDFYKHNPTDPTWVDRDRFILSNGHGSMLQYALLHLAGYELPIAELKNFRQLHSKTPGHPEVFETPGVETTTGPLGQGLANAVGFALAEKVLGKRFNRPGHAIVDHKTWVFLGDGCLMEGISHEAASLAGTLGLGKLIALYDDNGISIDGKVQGWFSDDTPKRFEAYGWQVLANVDGHDAVAIKGAIATAIASEKPSLICLKTVIGFGSPNKAGSESSHGSPLGKDEITITREKLGWTHGAFEIPAEIYAAWDAKAKGEALQHAWNDRLDAYERAHPALAQEFARVMRNDLPANWSSTMQTLIAKFNTDAQSIASRKASQMVLETIVAQVPELIGGSADLAHSNYSIVKASHDANSAEGGNYVYYGVREFAMTAIANGLSLHGGLIPYTATFLVFSDYARNAVRLSALMGIRNIHVYTHDSIGLGEDGPTHQPVEHLASLRLMPNLDVWRPADAVESAVAWKSAVERKGPTALVFSRQNLAHQTRSETQITNISRGGYVLLDVANPKLILIATGSEVGLAMQAAAELNGAGHATRVVSMPSTLQFDQQDAAYKESVLPKSVRARIAVEAASADYWLKYVGLDGAVIGMQSFGASAPDKALYQHFGITKEAIIAAAQRISG